jgi:UDP-glucose 4-epimerase
MTTADNDDGRGRRVLVTGGAGFIGLNLIETLAAAGYVVTVFDTSEAGLDALPGGGSMRFVQGDVRDAAALGRAIEGCSAVVHLAAQTGVPGSVEDPRTDCDINVLGTLNVLEAARRASSGDSPLRVVFASSNAPMGRQAPPAREDAAPLPVSPYGASKLAGEAYCLAYHGSFGLGTVALRFANVYGPRSGHKTSVVAAFIRDALAGAPLTVYGDGAQTRDFIYVDDLCRAVVAALQSDAAGEIYQIATGVETSINELIDILSEVSGRRLDVRRQPARVGDVARNFSDISKARDQLAWQPSVSLREGLSTTWSWFASETGSGGSS